MARRTKAQVQEDEALIKAIVDSLYKNPQAVTKAILILGDNQTPGEKDCKATVDSNGIGFSMVHATYGTFLYNIAVREGKLFGPNLEAARKIALRYARTQLFAAAKAKREVSQREG